MKELDLTTWERKEIYDFFSNISNPFYMVTFSMDVTPLYQYAKSCGLSFYKSMIWACTQAINRIDAFKITSRSGKLFVLDQRNPSFTDMKDKTELFHIVTMEHIRDIHRFCAEANRLSREQETFVVSSKESDALIYYSCLPWLEITALTNERDLSDPNALNDNIPRISWGKFTNEHDRITINVALEVNHRFIDGIHIGKFADQLKTQINALDSGKSSF